MAEPTLYRGHWPKNVSKTAKYGIRVFNGVWKPTVYYDLGEGQRFLAIEDEDTEIAERVNGIKRAASSQEGGAFYVNEHQHLIVPVSHGDTTHYYCGGKVDVDFRFDFEGTLLTARPVKDDGGAMEPGDEWIGPRPGIPYVLAAGGADVYYDSPIVLDTDPPRLRERVTQRVKLSKVLSDKSAAAKTVKQIRDVRGHRGGRFYVNEHRAIFTPVSHDDGDGWHYVYCGQSDPAAWFPEPPIDEPATRQEDESDA